jgi:hypothetical protein
MKNKKKDSIAPIEKTNLKRSGIEIFDEGNTVFYFGEYTGELLVHYTRTKEGKIIANYKKEQLIDDFCLSRYDSIRQYIIPITDACGHALDKRNSITKAGIQYAERISAEAKFENAKRQKERFLATREAVEKEMIENRVKVHKNMEIAKLNACNALAKKLTSLIPKDPTAVLPDADVNKVIQLL